MATIVIRHPVADYGAWRQVYDSAEDLRQSHGITGARVLCDPADRNMVLVTHDFPTAAQAQAFLADPGLREVMGRAGVVGEPHIEVYEEP